MDAWEFSQHAAEEFDLPIIWYALLRRPPGMDLWDLCGYWHGYVAANDDKF